MFRRIFWNRRVVCRLMSNDYRRYHLAHDEPYKNLNLIHKYDTASLTVQDLWELKQAAYREGYLRAMDVRQYRDTGLE